MPTPLVGIGGSIRAFDAAHPSGAGGYGAPLSIDGAVVLAFTRSLVPSISAAAAKELLLSDLPSDTKVIADISQATCEQIWVTSSSIQSAMQARGSLVVVTLTTPGISTYDPRRVGLLTFDSDLVHRPGERGC